MQKENNLQIYIMISGMWTSVQIHETYSFPWLAQHIKSWPKLKNADLTIINFWQHLVH